MNAPMIIGRQAFDGLGRQLSVVAGGYTTRYDYIDGQMPPAANILADGKRVEFSYERQLNNQLLSVAPQGEPAQRIAYHPLGMPASASGALGVETFGFTPSGQPDQDIWTVDDTEHRTRWSYSMGGLLQGFEDAQGKQHRRRLDDVGRVIETQVDTVTTVYEYDALSRPIRIIVNDPQQTRTLTTSLTYDSLSREHTRSFTSTSLGDGDEPVSQTFVQTLSYSALDQITSRIWDDGESQGEEGFEYDLRGRLVKYTANDIAAPADPFGNHIVSQDFTFNALNGYEQVVTTFADQTRDTASFTYAESNPTQVVQITHTHESWPAEIILTYDDCGRVIRDSLGRHMVWNAQDRLVEVRHNEHTCNYGYTAHGRLADRTVDDTLSRSFFSGDELTHETTGDEHLQYHAGAQGVFAVSKVSAGIRQTTLLGNDAQGSVKLEIDDSVRARRYSAHGVERQDSANAPIGYTGQRNEPLTGWQILGDYRPYDPVLMCFLSPDSESPFGRGGINPYAYCAGDPVNRIDPDGHSWVTYALAGVGFALGAAAAVSSLGAASGVVAALMASGLSSLTPSGALVIGAAALDIVSLATSVAATSMQLSGADANTANVLGWVSFGAGLASGALMSARALGRATTGRGGTSGIEPASWAKAKNGGTQVLHSTPSGKVEVAYHERLWGQNLRAFETHGGSDSTLMNVLGSYEPAATIARREIAPRLADYAQGRPLVLLACEGGSSGAAQQVANVLQRPVIGYDKVIYITSTKNLSQPPYFTLGGGDVWTNLPTQKISWLKRLAQHDGPTFFGKKNRELATYRTYLPE